MTDPSKAGGHPVRGVLAAAVAVALLALGACSNSKDSAATTAPAAGSTAAPSGSAASDANGDADAGATDAQKQAGALLGEALAELGSSYHFVTTVRVGDQVIMTAEGDRVGAGVRLELTSEAGVVSYVVTADGSWAKPENGVWDELDVPAAATDPMAALIDAQSVTLGPEAEGVQQIEVEVSNEALGIAGGGTATVIVQVQGSKVSQVSYSTTVSGQRAEITTVFGDVRDPSEVVAPV